MSLAPAAFVGPGPASPPLLLRPPTSSLARPVLPPPLSAPTALWRPQPHRPLQPLRPLTALPPSLLLLGDATTAGTWASLLGSATLGLALERRTRAGRALGASLLAFLLQAVMANGGLVPTESTAYDACWSSVLPASLSLSVLLAVDAASKARGLRASSISSIGSSKQRKQQRGWWLSTPLAKISIAYVWGALGSLAGAVLAFHVTAAVFPPSAAATAGRLARPVLARVAAAVAATYVGGSVNFFQVARAVGLGDGEGGQGLMGAVAGADIFLMALYFAALIGMQRSQPRGMAAFLQPEGTSGYSSNSGSSSRARAPEQIVDMPAASSTSTTRRRAAGLNPLFKPLQHLAAFALAATMGQAGQWAERRAGVPGAAAAATTAVSLAAYSLCRRLSPRAFAALAARAPSLSAFLFALFFAAIGAGASLGHLLLSGPCVLLLMGLALAAHVAATALALRLHNTAAAAADPSRRIGVDEMVIASNANIGGPATAAAMAASIGRPDLVLAATATGTLGYSAATWLGVALYGWLMASSGGGGG